MTNCVNCGAILHGNKCEYCGTEYENSDYTDSNNSYDDIDSWTDCDGVLHRTINNHRAIAKR